MLATPKLVALVMTATLVSVGALVVVTVGSTPGGGSDYGLDTNGNGLYDWLVVKLDEKVDAANYYTVIAILGASTPSSHGCGMGYPYPLMGGPVYPGMGDPTPGTGQPTNGTTTPPIMYPYQGPVYPISTAVSREFLEAGDQTITLAFRGTDIAYAGVDGPYTVWAYILQDGRGGLLGGYPGLLPPGQPWTYTTAAYKAADFESPRYAIRFTGEHADHGVDTNGNGTFEYLDLTAQVDVSLAGTYMYSAFLTGPTAPYPPGDVRPGPWNGTWGLGLSAFGTVDLAAGRQTLEARFDGGQIWSSGYSGSFNFTMAVYYGGMMYGWLNGTTGGPGGMRYPTDPGYDLYGDTLCGGTASYPHDAWDEPVLPAAFTGVFADRGVDVNGDGTYDFLAVDAEVDVRQSTWVTLDGLLSSGDGAQAITTDQTGAYLSPGVQNLTLRFYGPSIRASGIDGPYLAGLTLQTPAGTDRATHTTAAYAHTDFDANGNGTRGMLWIANLTADASAIDVSVERAPDAMAVMMNGTVHVVAVTSDGRTAFEGDGTFSISSGQVLTLPFSWSPSPGTYQVRATLDSPWGTDAKEIYVTI